MGNGTITIQTKDEAVTVATGGDADVFKVAEGKSVAEFKQGRQAMALYATADKLAQAALMMPEPRPRG